MVKINDIYDMMPKEFTMNMTYVPVFMQMTAFKLSEIVLDSLAAKRASEVKKTSRNLRNLIKDQMHRYRDAVSFDVYNSIQDSLNEFMSFINNDITLYYYTYEQIYKNQFEDADKYSQEMAYLSIANDIMNEIIVYDKECEDKVNEKLKETGSKEVYVRPRVWVIDAFFVCFKEITDGLKYNPEINNNININNARKILAKNCRAVTF